MNRLLTCLVLAVLAAPAAACINDIELPSHEREFRYQYRRPESPSTTPAPKSVDPYRHQLMAWAGTALMAVAAGLALAGNRTGK